MTDIARNPIIHERTKQEAIEKEALRVSIMAEVNAINLFEQLANMVKRMDLKEILLDVAKEKHVPVVQISANKVTFKVGSVAHPMEEKHYIE